MARKHSRPEATTNVSLEPCQTRCWVCGGPLWVAYRNVRTISTLAGLQRLTLRIRRCEQVGCDRYRRPYRPEEEGAWALPHGEFGLDVIALVGALRYHEHRSVPEIHTELEQRGVAIAERTVTHLLHRYEELVALRMTDNARLAARLSVQGSVILALDGLQPDMGHEVLWVLRDCLSGEVLLARSLLSATTEDLAGLLNEVRNALPVPIRGVISDGQQSIRRAVAAALPGVPHQLCQFHYLREAARPIFEADRHAKTQLKELVRGVRPIERQLENRSDPVAQAVHGYCLAVRSALTEDGRPPLRAAGLRLHERLTAIHASLDRVVEARGIEKGAVRANCCGCGRSWRAGSLAPPRTGRSCGSSTAGCTAPPRSWRTARGWTAPGYARSMTDFWRTWPRAATRWPPSAQLWPTS